MALSNGDSSRARRFNRGVKTLVELERRAAAGLAVREEDIPPVVSAGQRRPAADPGPGPTPAGGGTGSSLTLIMSLLAEC